MGNYEKNKNKKKLILMPLSPSLEEIKKFWPEKAPDINIVQKYVSKYENEKIVIKYGGNVLIDRKVFNNFI